MQLRLQQSDDLSMTMRDRRDGRAYVERNEPHAVALQCVNRKLEVHIVRTGHDGGDLLGMLQEMYCALYAEGNGARSQGLSDVSHRSPTEATENVFGRYAFELVAASPKSRSMP